MTTNAFWSARWVWLTPSELQGIRMCLFRRTFEVPAGGLLKIHVSADSRYRLFLDGKDIGEGPAAGDPLHYHYESYGQDGAIQLQPGKHVLVAQVLSYMNHGPLNEMHIRAGFIAEGGVVDATGNRIVDLCTPGDWRVTDDPSYGIEMGPGGARGYWALGFMERIDLRKSPGDWKQLDFDDSAWPKTAYVGDPVLDEVGFVTLTPWVLFPRPIPMMDRLPQRFKSVARVTEQGANRVAAWTKLVSDTSAGTQTDADAVTDAIGLQTHPNQPSAVAESSAPSPREPVLIPANAKVSIILEHGALTTAYPRIATQGGRGTTIRLTYAEGFSLNGKKEKRDDSTGREIEGSADEVVLSGSPSVYEPFRWRTFRYVQVDITTADEPLEITDIDSVFTGYPFKLGASFDSDHELLTRFWPLCWRTSRLCAQEHYTDCPYYEQLQYVGDTLIQALISCLLTGDNRLFARAIRDFDRSRLTSGLTQSRFPSHHPQIINTFSLIYVQMVEHYYIQTGDAELTRQMIPGLAGVVEWFLGQVRDDNGLIGPTKWWTFVDWTRSWSWGDPTHKPGNNLEFSTGPSTVVNLQIVGAMQSLERLYEKLGDPFHAKSLRAKSKQIQQAINKVCWSSQRSLYSDSPTRTPGCENFSEHANLMAILTDTASASRQQQIATTLRRYPLQTRAGYYFEFYLALAYTKLGRVDDVFDRLQDWKDILDLGLSTMPETPHRLGGSRSDCHAWSAWPAWWSLTGILGIEPDAPGYAAIRITPRLGRLTRASGTAMTPRGPVSVLVRKTETGLSIEGDTPPQTPCRIVLPDGRVVEHAGGAFTAT